MTTDATCDRCGALVAPLASELTAHADTHEGETTYHRIEVPE